MNKSLLDSAVRRVIVERLLADGALALTTTVLTSSANDTAVAPREPGNQQRAGDPYSRRHLDEQSRRAPHPCPAQWFGLHELTTDLELLRFVGDSACTAFQQRYGCDVNSTKTKLKAKINRTTTSINKPAARA